MKTRKLAGGKKLQLQKVNSGKTLKGAEIYQGRALFLHREGWRQT